MFNDPRKYHRPFWGSLVFTQEGDLDLSWLFVLLLGLVGVAAVVWSVIIRPISVPVQVAAFSFLGAAFASVLIAAIPIAKAKILASSRLPGEVARGIASVGQANVETSTDIEELTHKLNNGSDEDNTNSDDNEVG